MKQLSKLLGVQTFCSSSSDNQNITVFKK